MIGLGYIWEQQEVPRDNEFFITVLATAKNQHLQRWFSGINSTCSSKRYFKLSTFMNHITNGRKFRRAIASLRLSSHRLEIKTGRHKNKARGEGICNFMFTYYAFERRKEMIKSQGPIRRYFFCNLSIQSHVTGLWLKSIKYFIVVFVMKQTL